MDKNKLLKNKKTNQFFKKAILTLAVASVGFSVYATIPVQDGLANGYEVEMNQELLEADSSYSSFMGWGQLANQIGFNDRVEQIFKFKTRLALPKNGEPIKILYNKNEFSDIQQKVIKNVVSYYNYIFEKINPDYKFIAVEQDSNPIRSGVCFSLSKMDIKESITGRRVLGKFIMTESDPKFDITYIKNGIIQVADINEELVFNQLLVHEFGHGLALGDTNTLTDIESIMSYNNSTSLLTENDFKLLIANYTKIDLQKNPSYYDEIISQYLKERQSCDIFNHYSADLDTEYIKAEIKLIYDRYMNIPDESKLVDLKKDETYYLHNCSIDKKELQDPNYVGKITKIEQGQEQIDFFYNGKIKVNQKEAVTNGYSFTTYSDEEVSRWFELGDEYVVSLNCAVEDIDQEHNIALKTTGNVFRRITKEQYEKEYECLKNVRIKVEDKNEEK